jgi:hypothetical protein
MALHQARMCYYDVCDGHGIWFHINISNIDHVLEQKLKSIHLDDVFEIKNFGSFRVDSIITKDDKNGRIDRSGYFADFDMDFVCTML